MPQQTLVKLDFTPKSQCCMKGHLILKATFDSCHSLMSTFAKNKVGQGAPKNSDQDLLRAMLVFASSGLDAMIKQLILDALPLVIEKRVGSFQQFVAYVEKQLLRDSKDSAKFLANSITASNPKSAMVQGLIASLRADSLQSKDQIFQAASYFDIASAKLINKPNDLKDVFVIRNMIIHEMDVNLEGANRKRHHRKKDEIVKNANTLLNVAVMFLSEVDQQAA